MTPPLEQDMEVTGSAVVNLWASSSAVDTDFTAKLVDIYPPSADFPAGVELNVADSIVRARYRDSLEKASLMRPRQVYRFQIRMYPTSLVFAKGTPASGWIFPAVIFRGSMSIRTQASLERQPALGGRR